MVPVLDVQTDLLSGEQRDVSLHLFKPSEYISVIYHNSFILLRIQRRICSVDLTKDGRKSAADKKIPSGNSHIPEKEFLGRASLFQLDGCLDRINIWISANRTNEARRTERPELILSFVLSKSITSLLTDQNQEVFLSQDVWFLRMNVSSGSEGPGC